MFRSRLAVKSIQMSVYLATIFAIEVSRSMVEIETKSATHTHREKIGTPGCVLEDKILFHSVEEEIFGPENEKNTH